MNKLSLTRQQGAISVIALAVFSAALVYLPRFGNAQQEKIASMQGERTTAPVTVSLTLAEPKEMSRSLEITGTVRPQFESALAARIMGRVAMVAVREGELVQAGQTLVRLDDRDLEVAIHEAGSRSQMARIGLTNSLVARRMEDALSDARIAEAKAALKQSEAAWESARSRWQLSKIGARPQERAQAAQAVNAAKANLGLAEATLRRMSDLYQKEAIAKQQLDQTQAQYDTAKAQYEQAVQAQSITEEGNRAEEIRAAEEAVRQAAAGIAAAKAAVRTAEASALQKDVRQQQVEQARTQIQQADAGLALARVNRSFAVVNAPFEGIVSARMVDPGALVNPGVPLLKVQGGGMRLEAVVPESALSAVRVGQTIPLRFDALPGKSLVGKVVEITPQGDSMSHTFRVKVEAPADSGMMAGMFGRAKVIVGRETRLVVPLMAVLEREGLHYVYVVDKEQVAHLRMVTVGAKEAEDITILSGLQAGERVISSGREAVCDGATVRVKP